MPLVPLGMYETHQTISRGSGAGEMLKTSGRLVTRVATALDRPANRLNVTNPVPDMAPAFANTCPPISWIYSSIMPKSCMKHISLHRVVAWWIRLSKISKTELSPSWSCLYITRQTAAETTTRCRYGSSQERKEKEKEKKEKETSGKVGTK